MDSRFSTSSRGSWNWPEILSSFMSVTAVSEPSTYMMALAGLACGGYTMFRRRKRT